MQAVHAWPDTCPVCVCVIQHATTHVYTGFDRVFENTDFSGVHDKRAANAGMCVL